MGMLLAVLGVCAACAAAVWRLAGKLGVWSTVPIDGVQGLMRRSFADEAVALSPRATFPSIVPIVRALDMYSFAETYEWVDPRCHRTPRTPPAHSRRSVRRAGHSRTRPRARRSARASPAHCVRRIARCMRPRGICLLPRYGGSQPPTTRTLAGHRCGPIPQPRTVGRTTTRGARWSALRHRGRHGVPQRR